MAQHDRSFANTQLLQLFPTCVWLHDLRPEDYEPINRRIAPVIRDLVADKRPFLANLTWQTHHDLHRHEAFAELTAFAGTAVRGVLDHLQVDYGDFEITGCWANVNPRLTQHRAHTHPNNFLSGVYYVEVPDGRDGLVFHEPRPQALVISPKVKKLTALTGSEANVEVREGRLVIFPSWLEHSVATTRAEGERISVSFNFMLSSYTEDFSPPRWSNR